MARKIKNQSQPITAGDLDIAIRMLTTHVGDPGIGPLIAALERLKTAPDDATCQGAVIDAFDNLGILQGAALTYAPYLHIFVSDDPFGDGPLNR